jgi:hypothetical protein
VTRSPWNERRDVTLDLEEFMRKPTRSDQTAVPFPASDSPSTDLKRRRFLVALGAGGAGAAATVASAVPVAAAAQATAAPAPEAESGYRESAHVRDYYRTAKL